MSQQTPKVMLKRSKKARRWRLVVNHDAIAMLTVPHRLSQQVIAKIIGDHSAWIESRVKARRAAIDKARSIYEDHNGLIPFFGEWIDPFGISADFYRKEARKFFSAECVRLAETIGVGFDRIRIADQKSRYGSCSAHKTLSFSWRIIKAPLFVAEYIAAHEVAHLKYMHHKKTFWECVAYLSPKFETAEKWLKENNDFLRFDPC
jgi:predicted metal-dependent hydrolase